MIKLKRLASLAVLCVSSAAAQTLYVPGGTVGTASTAGVGIGTSAPSAKLDINAGASTGLYITTANGGPWGMIMKNLTYPSGVFSMYQADDGWTWMFSGYPNGARIALGPNGNLGLNAGGANVGIGTNTPQFKLEVSGDGLFSKDAFAQLTTHTSSGSANRTSGVNFRIDNVDLWQLITDNSASNSFYVQFNKTASQRFFTVTTDGKVGIGTTNPSYRLSLEGGTSSYLMRGHSAGDFIFALAGDGIAGTNQDLFSIRNNNTGAVHLNTLNGARLALGVSSASSAGTIVEQVTITSGGNVGIGTTNPTQKLSVKGTVRAQEVIVDTGWSDYVFDENYHLSALSEVERRIKAEKHLPGIPSAQQVAEKGVSVGEMQAILLAKIEELTLHAIAQEKRIEQIEAENRALRVQMRSIAASK